MLLEPPDSPGGLSGAELPQRFRPDEIDQVGWPEGDLRMEEVDVGLEARLGRVRLAADGALVSEAAFPTRVVDVLSFELEAFPTLAVDLFSFFAEVEWVWKTSNYVSVVGMIEKEYKVPQ